VQIAGILNPALLEFGINLLVELTLSTHSNSFRHSRASRSGFLHFKPLSPSTGN
jgi:hypothetical protein